MEILFNRFEIPFRPLESDNQEIVKGQARIVQWTKYAVLYEEALEVARRLISHRPKDITVVSSRSLGYHERPQPIESAG